jgi:hypothetical protein
MWSIEDAIFSELVMDHINDIRNKCATKLTFLSQCIFTLPWNVLIMPYLSASTWEIRRLNSPGSSTGKSVVTLMLEIAPTFWDRWKRRHSSNFDRSIPFALLSQVAGWSSLLLLKKLILSAIWIIQ